MADATQVQIRRDTASNLSGVTPALAEPGYDTTNKRLIMGDGLTLGGIPHPNAFDVQNGAFNTATAGGTGNALTLTFSPAPVAYATLMAFKFIASNTNTGASTLNVNGLGTRNIYKVSGGSVGALAAGDIVNGGVYEAIYDGTQFILISVAQAGITTVEQGDINSSTGTFSGQTVTSITTAAGGSTIKVASSVLAPGGEYGFGLQQYFTGAGTLGGFWDASASAGSPYTSTKIPWSFTTGNPFVFGQQRYINASPPFDLGDGEVAGFFYVMVNNQGDIVSTYIANVPPFAYNGPTKIKADHICPVTKKKYRTVYARRTLEEAMDGAPLKLTREEITNEMKNRDMNVIPHPFPDKPPGHTVVLLDPMDDKIRRLIDFQNAGGSIEVADYIEKGKFEVGDPCKRCSPDKVSVHKLKYRYEKKF